MREYNFNKEMQSVMNNFEQLDFSNPVEIIDWFYKSCLFNSMFEDENIYQFVLDKLSNNGYKEAEDKGKAIKEYYTVMDANLKGNLLISIIMNYIVNGDIFDEALIINIEMYEYLYNKKNYIEYMMEQLNNNINKTISFEGYVYGKNIKEKGILEDVEINKSFKVNNVKYPFIGFEVLIKVIYDEDNKVLFRNNVINYQKDLSDMEEMEQAKSDFFGNIN